MPCVHHWLIEPPAGRMSKAICKHCGLTTEFANSMQTGGWMNMSRDARERAAAATIAAKASAKAAKARRGG